MQHAAVAKIVALLRGQKLSHSNLYLIRILRIDESKPVRHPNKMGIRHHGRFSVNVAHNQICCFAPYSGQGGEGFHRVRYNAVKRIADFLGHADDIPRLAVIKPTGVDDLLHIFYIRFAKGLQRRISFKQNRCHQVHSRIGALGGKARGDQQL